MYIPGLTIEQTAEAASTLEDWKKSHGDFTNVAGGPRNTYENLMRKVVKIVKGEK